MATKAQQPHARIRLKFDEHVEIALLVEIFAQGRAKERELANLVSAGKLVNIRTFDKHGLLC